MDALLTLSTILIALVALAALSASFGVDSRDGFADDRVRRGLR
jgi:hypothetical protein